MQARILSDDGKETVMSASVLKKGNVVLVKAGEVIPNDGEVIEGIASVDESAITGESAPVLKESGGDFCVCHWWNNSSERLAENSDYIKSGRVFPR
mgnify:CR=1 FL=1